MMPQIVDVNAVRGRHGTALQVASVDTHKKVIQILLEAEADVTAGKDIMVMYIVLICMI